MEEDILQQIVYSIQSGLSNVAKESQEFRIEAERQNFTISKFMSDLSSKFFTTQSKLQSDLNNSMDEVERQSAATNQNINELQSITQESVSLLSQISLQMKNVANGIGSLVQLFQQNSGQNQFSFGGMVGGGLGALVGGAAATAAVGAGLSTLVSAGSTAQASEMISPSNEFTNQNVSGSTADILKTIKTRESGGDYGIESKSSSASGAYQFIDSTWQSLTQKYGIGTEYSRAFMAPPNIQDAVAGKYVEEILSQNNNDISKVPIVWYTGNSQGKMSQKALDANNGLTPEAYQSKWLNDFNNITGSNSNGGELQASNITGSTAPDPNLPQAYQQPSKTSGTGKDLGEQAASAGGIIGAATKMLGMNETKDYQTLNNFLNQYSGTPPLPINTDSGPWCAKFVNGILGSQGIQGTGSNASRSFLNYGATVYDKATGQGDPKQAKPGDIVIFPRGNDPNKGHVAFVESVSGETISIIGGNQGGRRAGGGGVTRESRNLSSVLSIRRPGAQGQIVPNAAPTPSSVGGNVGQNSTAGLEANPFAGTPFAGLTAQIAGALGSLAGFGQMGAGMLGGGMPMMGGAGMLGAAVPMIGNVVSGLSSIFSNSNNKTADYKSDAQAVIQNDKPSQVSEMSNNLSVEKTVAELTKQETKVQPAADTSIQSKPVEGVKGATFTPTPSSSLSWVDQLAGGKTKFNGFNLGGLLYT